MALRFAAVGAENVVNALAGEGGPWRRRGAITLRRIASDRVVNYVRTGDGIVRQRTGRRRRSGVLGREVLISGLRLEEIQDKEIANFGYEEDFWLRRKVRQGSLEALYFENHSLKSYYSSDFLKPVDQIFDHVWDHYVDGAPPD